MGATLSSSRNRFSPRMGVTAEVYAGVTRAERVAVGRPVVPDNPLPGR